MKNTMKDQPKKFSTAELNKRIEFTRQLHEAILQAARSGGETIGMSESMPNLAFAVEILDRMTTPFHSVRFRPVRAAEDGEPTESETKYGVLVGYIDLLYKGSGQTYFPIRKAVR